MKQKVRLWDIVRKRVWIDVSKVNYRKFKKKLVEEFGRKSGIVRYFKKPVFESLKGEVIVKRFRGKEYLSFKPKRWKKEEIKLLRELAKKFRGKKLVDEFNKRVMIPRSESSILTKLSRIKKRKRRKKG